MKITFRNCEYNDCDFILNLKELGIKWYIEKIYGWDTDIQREKTKHEIENHKLKHINLILLKSYMKD